MLADFRRSTTVVHTLSSSRGFCLRRSRHLNTPVATHLRTNTRNRPLIASHPVAVLSAPSPSPPTESSFSAAHLFIATSCPSELAFASSGSKLGASSSCPPFAGYREKITEAWRMVCLRGKIMDHLPAEPGVIGGGSSRRGNESKRQVSRHLRHQMTFDTRTEKHVRVLCYAYLEHPHELGCLRYCQSFLELFPLLDRFHKGRASAVKHRIRSALLCARIALVGVRF